MKIIKPLTLSLLHRTYRQGGQNHLVATALGFFKLGGDLPARLLPEAPQWARVMAVLSSGQPLDEAMPKACAEALVLGAACAPQGQPVTQMKVRLQVGTSIDKQLLVHGPRHWRYGVMPLYTIDPGAAFIEMPLDYAHAFGGPQYADNPAGQGYNPNRLAALVGTNEGVMANVEYASQPLRAHTGHYPPAALGPMAIDWAPRKRYAGTHDQRWLKEDYPGLPRDLDWRLYNQAAADQRHSDWFEGGEPYRLEGMHAQHSVISGRLPTQRVRAFALLQGTQGTTSQPHEISMHMDTVWFVPSLGLGIAAWRGQHLVADSDALDVQALMLGYEVSAKAAQPLAHYTQVLALRMNPATAGLHAFNESQLAPAPAPIARPASPPDLSAQQARIDEVSQAFWQASGMTPEADYQPPKASPPLLQTPTAEQIAQGDMDLSALMAQVQTLRTHIEQTAQAHREELHDQLGQLQTALDGATIPATAHAAAPVDASPASGADAWQAIVSRADGSADADQIQALIFATQASAANDPSPEVAARNDAAIKAAQAALTLKPKARLVSPKLIAPAGPLAPELAVRLGQQALVWLAQGLSLAGRDLAGANLRGAQLAGLDLSGCLLECADLSGADLSGARLCQTVLTQATLVGTNLSATDLTGANLCFTQAQRACFEQASLRGVQAMHAQWEGAQGPGADLSSALLNGANMSHSCWDGANLERTVFTDANLTASQWRAAKFNQCVGWKVQGQGADFSQSRWTRSALVACELSASRWQGARLSQLQGNASNWQGADFSGIQAQRCGWPAGQLSGANFSAAYVADSDLSGADLRAATLDHGCFSRSLLMRTQLSGASAQGTDFFQALLRKANFSGADLRGASLYQAELTEICLVQAQTQSVRMDPKRVLP